MKKKILIGAAIAVALIIIIVAAVLIFKTPPMLSQEKENVTAVTLTLNPGAANEVTTQLLQKADMYTVYALIEKAESRSKVSYESEDAAHNSGYEIIITYKDGAQDKFFSAEDSETDSILRSLNPDATAEEQEFVRGTAKGLAAHLKIWFN